MSTVSSNATSTLAPVPHSHIFATCYPCPSATSTYIRHLPPLPVSTVFSNATSTLFKPSKVFPRAVNIVTNSNSGNVYFFVHIFWQKEFSSKLCKWHFSCSSSLPANQVLFSFFFLFLWQRSSLSSPFAELGGLMSLGWPVFEFRLSTLLIHTACTCST